jgi:3-hydroxybutyryl-CoA dehydrogenase
MNMQTIGVVGAGVIGSSLSQHISASGLEVLLVDESVAALAAARKTIERNMRLQAMFKKEDAAARETVNKGGISFLSDIDKLSGADYIVECVTEKFDIKREVFIKLDEICKEGCIIATNTSAIPVSRLAETVHRKEQVIGLHFMNPVPLIGAVEMISGIHTSEQTLETTREFLTRIDKEWIHVKDSPGFVSNRILMTTINEAIFTLQDGVAAAASIDKVFRSCFNHKMGPLETADLIGLDTILYTLEVLHEHFRDDKFKPCPRLRKMVESGDLGRKSGRGFYDYSTD